MAMSPRKILLASLLLVIPLLGAAIIQRAILGGSIIVKLKPAPLLTGQVSQSLGANPDGSLPTYGKDYALQVRFFDNNVWMVGNIKSLKNTTDTAVIVMEKQGGSYRTMLGPGSAFPLTQVQSLPNDVGAYLSSQAAIYE